MCVMRAGRLMSLPVFHHHPRMMMVMMRHSRRRLAPDIHTCQTEDRRAGRIARQRKPLKGNLSQQSDDSQRDNKPATENIRSCRRKNPVCHKLSGQDAFQSENTVRRQPWPSAAHILQAGSLPVHAGRENADQPSSVTKANALGVPTGVKLQVKVRTPVSPFTRNVVTESLRWFATNMNCPLGSKLIARP